MPLDRLTGLISEQAAHINAATCRWLLMVAEFDRREGWGDWGARSCAHWLSYRCGLSPAAGREHVRVARALEGLPLIRAAFAGGELCYSQVRALSRIADEEIEANLLMIARHATAGQLEVIVRAYRGVLAAGGAAPAHRCVRCDHDDDGSLLIRARLPAEEGALVLAALEAGRDAIREARALGPQPTASDAEQADADPAGVLAPGAAEAGSASAETTHIGDNQSGALADGSGRPGAEPPAADAPSSVSNADALLLMAQTLLATGPAERGGGDDYQVVVHVDAATLAAHEHGHDRDRGHDHGHDPDHDLLDHRQGPCQLDHGPALHPETGRRLACDASLVRILERDGRPLSVGRKTRSIPPALRRALNTRDAVCRFPGCPQRRFLHAHHVRHWAHGGTTDLHNLIRLCSHHHRLVHEGGYRVTPGTRGTLLFQRPDGQTLPHTVPRTAGRPDQLRRENQGHGLSISDQTCVPTIYPGDRLDLDCVVDGLAQTDPRLSPTR